MTNLEDVGVSHNETGPVTYCINIGTGPAVDRGVDSKTRVRATDAAKFQLDVWELSVHRDR